MCFRILPYVVSCFRLLDVWSYAIGSPEMLIIGVNVAKYTFIGTWKHGQIMSYKYAGHCIWYKCLNSAELMVLVLFWSSYLSCMFNATVFHMWMCWITQASSSVETSAVRVRRVWRAGRWILPMWSRGRRGTPWWSCVSAGGLKQGSPHSVLQSLAQHTCLEASSIQARPWWAASGVLDYGWS